MSDEEDSTANIQRRGEDFSVLLQSLGNGLVDNNKLIRCGSWKFGTCAHVLVLSASLHYAKAVTVTLWGKQPSTD